MRTSLIKSWRSYEFANAKGKAAEVPAQAATEEVMIFVALIVAVYLMEWMFFTETWALSLGAKYLVIALLWTALFNSDKKSLFVSSTIALLTVFAWFDLAHYLIWVKSNQDFDFALPIFLTFLTWFVFILQRNYHFESDRIDPFKVNILVLKPRTPWETIKGLIGFPAASICIVAANMVWCYRKRTGRFERTSYQMKWLSTHSVINTGVACSGEMVKALEQALGEKSNPPIKCVYTIRHFLNLVGGKYAIKTWLDYIPGFYILRIRGQ